jgi:hypothetical protein
MSQTTYVLISYPQSFVLVQLAHNWSTEAAHLNVKPLAEIFQTFLCDETKVAQAEYCYKTSAMKQNWVISLKKRKLTMKNSKLCCKVKQR